MPIALAGMASVFIGAADFLGGFAASGWRAERVAAVAQVVGVVLVLAVAPAFGDLAPAGDLGWGIAAGAVASVGLALLYRSLAIGPMNVAAPTVAVIAAVVPTIVGLVLGERPSAVASAGVVLAVGAVALVGGASAPGPTEPRASGRVLLLAAAAGAAFGLANVAIAQTSEESGLWPLGATKVVAGVALWAFVLLRAGPGDVPAARRNVTAAVWTGGFDAVGSMALVLALQRGSLVLVSVLGALFPAVTVVLARVVLDEPIGRAQLAGLVLAMVAVAMIVAG
jgi:drug/metabolite transporter (DMT)-like permease